MCSGVHKRLPIGNIGTMSDYRSPIKDSLFALRHLGMLDDLTKIERFSHADADTVEEVLAEHGRFMDEVFAPLNASGDREGLTWSPEGVTTPAGFKEAYAKFVEAGWQGFNADPEYGGAGFPEAVFVMAAEYMIAANGACRHGPRPHHRRDRPASRSGPPRSRRRSTSARWSPVSGPAR